MDNSKDQRAVNIMTEEKIMPCKCGNIPISEWVDDGKHNGSCHYEIRCDICRIVETGPDHGPAIAAWNERIKGEKANSNYAFIAIQTMIENKKIEVLQHTKIEMPLYMAEMLINKFLSCEDVKNNKKPADDASPAKNLVEAKRDAVSKLDPAPADKSLLAPENDVVKTNLLHPVLTQSEFEKLRIKLKAEAAAKKANADTEPAKTTSERPVWADSLEKVQGRRPGRPEKHVNQ